MQTDYNNSNDNDHEDHLRYLPTNENVQPNDISSEYTSSSDLEAPSHINSSNNSMRGRSRPAGCDRVEVGNKNIKPK